jgi:hypothetical protein
MSVLSHLNEDSSKCKQLCCIKNVTLWAVNTVWCRVLSCLSSAVASWSRRNMRIQSCSVLSCDALLPCRNILTFRSNLLPLFSRNIREDSGYSAKSSNIFSCSFSVISGINWDINSTKSRALPSKCLPGCHSYKSSDVSMLYDPKRVLCRMMTNHHHKFGGT